MELINLSTVFSTPEGNFPRDLLKPSIIRRNIQKVSVPFYYGDVKEHYQKSLNSLNLVKEIPRACKGNRCKFSKENKRNE